MVKNNSKRPQTKNCQHLKVIDYDVFNKKPGYISDNSCNSCNATTDIKYCLTCGHQACANHITEHITGLHYITMQILNISKLSFQIYCHKCKINHPSKHFNEFFKSIAKYFTISNVHTMLTTNSSAIDIKGLQNLGNTCFFNSTIQALLHMPVFVALLKSLTEIKNFYLINSFLKLYQSMSIDEKEKILNPRELLNGFYSKYSHFERGAQHDSHEFLLLFLDAISQEMKHKTDLNQNNLSVSEIFGGKFLSIFNCEKCITPGYVIEPFLDVSLSIPSHLDLAFPTKKGKKLNYEQKDKSQPLPDNPDECGKAVSKHQMKKLKKINRQVKGKRKRDSMSNASKEIMVSPKVTNELDDEGTNSTLTENLEKLNITDVPSQNDDADHNNDDNIMPKPPIIQIDRNFALYKLLDEFAKVETISNAKCERCQTKNVTITKKMSILQSNRPKILVLHLKRFFQTPRTFVKNNRDVSFPEILDIGSYCATTKDEESRKETICKNNGTQPITYSLNAVICHMGSLRNGHYYCYLRQQPSCKPSQNSSNRVSPETRIVKVKKHRSSLEELPTTNHDKRFQSYEETFEVGSSNMDVYKNALPLGIGENLIKSRKPSSEDNDSGYLSHIDLNNPAQPSTLSNSLPAKFDPSNITSPPSDLESDKDIDLDLRVDDDSIEHHLKDIPNRLYTYISDTQVKKNQKFGKISKSDAYLLFYEQL